MAELAGASWGLELWCPLSGSRRRRVPGDGAGRPAAL